jgi:hypothetical protein
MKKGWKKRLFATVLSLILILSVSGCSAKPSGSAVGVGAVMNADSHKLTRKQMLEDYDTMWKDIEDNYPLMGVAERTTGKNFSQIKAQYREKVRSASSDAGFEDVLNSCIREFKGCGHFALLDRILYSYSMSVYGKASNEHCTYLYKVLNNPASKTFYSYKPTDLYGNTQKAASANSGNSGNIETKILEKDRTAYLKIASFGSQYVAVDAPVIAKFFQQIKDFTSCIIDIRGNGGGSDLYWNNSILAPNLRRSYTYYNYALVRGEAAKRYLETEDKVYPISGFPQLPKINRSDLKKMKYFIKISGSVPAAEKPGFNGKFYLLTDGAVYSSSETFAEFCKQTGFATIVGEPTGGDGIGIDPMVFVLPHSGVCMRFSSMLGLNPDGGSNEEFGTQPDVPSAKGEDALQTCMNLIRNSAA